MENENAKERFEIHVSARHLHLTQETVDILFGKGHVIEPVEPTDSKQFLSTTRATVVGPKGRFENVAVMGPCRRINQFEISATDARTLGVPAVIRMSEDIEGTPGIKIIGTVGEVTIDKGVIVAKRHIHMSPSMAEKYDFRDGDNVLLAIESDARTLIFGDTIVRVGAPPEEGAMAHIDTDEGNAAGIGRVAYGYIAGKTEDIRKL
ncbi:MAG TPA: propanediol utilization protein [Papillibacter sp.]|nr:propanediol utilization protein [Papillibacter sp.]